MKKMLLAVALMALAGDALCSPYIQGLWTSGNKTYFSEGAVFMPSSMVYEQTFTNIAVIYHPLSAGSKIPESIQAIVPPESWACTIGGGYASASGNGISVGFGCGFNLLDSVRAWGANLLSHGNSTMQAMGEQISPGKGPLNLYASRQYDSTIDRPFQFAPRWFLGASFGF